MISITYCTILPCQSANIVKDLFTLICAVCVLSNFITRDETVVSAKTCNTMIINIGESHMHMQPDARSGNSSLKG